MALYTLPELPYDYAALEPVINPQIIELHHDKHHAARSWPRLPPPPRAPAGASSPTSR
jgi:hypothetical protein